MTRLSPEEHLAPTPRPVRRSMLNGRDALEPGAAAVVGRFFRVVSERREPFGAPSAQSFREAAASESTFRLLLRALAAHAPMVSTAGALPVKAEWVAKRPKRASWKQEGPKRDERADILAWPVSWQAYYTGLEQARIRPSSLRRYRASITRCARLVNQGVATEELNFLTAWHLAEALPLARKHGRNREEKLRPHTVANYIEGLVALGHHGGADPAALDGVRFVRDHLLDVADAGDKLKFARITEIMEAGGFEFVANRVGELRQQAADAPDHAAEKVSALQASALCAISMNKPGRTGDVSRWRLGEDLVREVHGTWRLSWTQEKTEKDTEAGDLWPEVSAVLDELILGGRPDRFIHLRYRELMGRNWLTLEDHARAPKWPSSVIKRAIGVPSHDLRTLAADYLRLHDPETAANVIATHLGHRTRDAGEAYRAEADGDAAARSWAEMRQAIAGW